MHWGRTNTGGAQNTGLFKFFINNIKRGIAPIEDARTTGDNPFVGRWQKRSNSAQPMSLCN